MCCSKTCWLIAGSVVGGLLAILGGVLFPVGDLLVESTIEKEVVIEKGTIAYDNWVKPGSEVYRQFWIFHVANPDAIINGGKPLLQQKGPYTYLVRDLEKSNITQLGNTVSFYQPNQATFQRHMSIGPEETNYTVLNLAVAAVPALIDAPLLIDTLIRTTNSSLFQERSVKEFLWGYRCPFLAEIPDQIMPDKNIGVFYPYNGTSDGPYIVFNGKEDISKVAIIDKYMGESSLSYWNDTYCDMINGTDGASFPPFVGKKDRLFFFSSEICRSMYGEFEKEYTLKGIKIYRFVVPSLVHASPLINPDNHCYCTELVLSRNCTGAGVLDLQKCQGGKPIYISLPHFMHASDFIMDMVDGLSPNKEEHETFVDVEPITGFTMHFAKRLQVNVMFQKNERITLFSKLPRETLLPVLWLNETAIIDDESVKMFKSAVTVPLTVLEVMQILLICLGSVMFLACSIALCVRSSKKKKGIRFALVLSKGKVFKGAFNAVLTG
ncbi:platelet glycoprotein 4-like [Hyperolius riggenbachi]|uniref:platelet glycoprotein 4-like n=1 Tax=Hyperolius riggenbachi TaxID=752182 RepID=UPI0035A344D9